MAYKQKGFSAHDNLKTRSKDLSGRFSSNQRTPQIKPSSSPNKLRYSSPGNQPGLDKAWMGQSIGSGMSNMAGNLATHAFMNQETSGFVNNPMLSSKAGNVSQGGQYGDFYGGKFRGGSSSGPQSVFSSKAAMEAAAGRSASASGNQIDLSEVSAKSHGNIKDMISSTIASVQARQDKNRTASLNKYKAAQAKAQSAAAASFNRRFQTYKTSQASKYNALQSKYNKMSEAQKKAAAAKAKAAIRRRRGGVVGKAVGTVGKVVGGVGKAAGGIVKAVGGVARGIGRAIGSIFGRRRRRRRRRTSKPKTTTPKTTTTTTKKVTPTKKAPTRRRRRRRRRRWFSDIRLKQNIMRVGSSLSGIPIYNFNYTGDNTIYQGAMAQDLISMGYNNAVTIDNKSGYYMVDYDQIDVDMIKI